MTAALALVGAAEEPALLPSGWAGGVVPPALRDGLALSEANARKAKALALYFEGLAAARDRDPTAAIARYQEVLRLDPSNLRLGRRLAEIYVRTQRPLDALAVLENALQANPRNPSAYIDLSEFCVRHHHGSEEIKQRGETVAREAVTRWPGDAAVQANLATYYLLGGARDQAVAVLEQAAARADSSADYWLGLARAAGQVWSLRTAEGRATVGGLYEKALALAPDDPAVLESVADFYALNGAVGEAADLYARIVQRRPEHLQAREKLARTLALSGRPDDAAAAWKKLLEIDPQSQTAHEAMAKFTARQGDLAASVRHRAEALRWNAREETWREALVLARDMLQLEMARDALVVLERAAFSAPASPEPPLLSALAHRQLKEYARAAAAFARAEEIALAPAGSTEAPGMLHEGFYYEWGLTSEAAGRLDEAEAKFRKAIELTPADAPEKAAKSYNALAYLWLEHDRQLDEARPLVQRALQFEPENAAYLDTLGWFHFKKREFPQAVDVLQRADKASPQPIAEILDHLAQAQWETGERLTALATLTRALERPDATDVMRHRLETWRAEASLPPASPGP